MQESSIIWWSLVYQTNVVCYPERLEIAENTARNDRKICLLQESYKAARSSRKGCLEGTITTMSCTSYLRKSVLQCVMQRPHVSLLHSRRANATCTLKEGPLRLCLTQTLSIWFRSAIMVSEPEEQIRWLFDDY